MFGNVTISSLNMDLFPIDNDILSLELDSSFRELFLVYFISNFMLFCLYFLTRLFISGWRSDVAVLRGAFSDEHAVTVRRDPQDLRQGPLRARRRRHDFAHAAGSRERGERDRARDRLDHPHRPHRGTHHWISHRSGISYGK